MGLSAGQARLLTLTGRKSDCEFASMKLSHQKIALSRDLADISNEYQNSLDQTKLIYDYYGTGDTTTPLSYGLLMSPSALNDYMPTTITDSLGRVTLNSKYASAARAAGIPQEGLGTLPSEGMRNAFIQGLYTSGILTRKTAETILGLPYNQQAGFGGGPVSSVITEDVTLDELSDMLNEIVVSPLDSSYNSEYTRGLSLLNVDEHTIESVGNPPTNIAEKYRDPFKRKPADGMEYTATGNSQVTLGDILSGNYILTSYSVDDRNSAFGYEGGPIDAVVNSSFWTEMFDALESMLDTGTKESQHALAYARSEIEKMISNNCDKSKGPGAFGGDDHSKDTKGQYFNDSDLNNFAYYQSSSSQIKYDGNIISQSSNMVNSNENGNGYIGLTAKGNYGKGRDDDSCISAVSVNLSSVFKAYLTYFMDAMIGVSKEDQYGRQLYDVKDQLDTSKLVDENTVFTIKTGVDVSSDDLGQATFYDALFNQICSNGWTENNKITDNEYLQEMLQSGMLYVSKPKDDGYYYQGNYATDPYIKEISDDTAIAQAEAKYQTEKAKLNSKEETLDLKMKNLDTEISSLTTEYDTVKNTISKNIEKSFKRYNA